MFRFPEKVAKGVKRLTDAHCFDFAWQPEHLIFFEFALKNHAGRSLLSRVLQRPVKNYNCLKSVLIGHLALCDTVTYSAQVVIRSSFQQNFSATTSPNFANFFQYSGKQGLNARSAPIAFVHL